MTVRPQHHRRPLPRPRRRWRRLLYNRTRLISLLSLLFRPRHHKTETVPTTLSVQMSAVFTALPTSVVHVLRRVLAIAYSLYSPTSLIRIRGSNINTRRPPQLSHQPALCSPNFQCSLPSSSSSPCRRSCSPVTTTSMTQPDVPLSRISLAVARYGPQQRTYQHSYWRRDHGQWHHRQSGLGRWTLTGSRRWR